ncbi:MAG: hypothetical protein M0P41_09580 [Sphaerochaeta sp.]|nr:hypothetical protein [Sphaerochaeta sp.]
MEQPGGIELSVWGFRAERLLCPEFLLDPPCAQLRVQDNHRLPAIVLYRRRLHRHPHCDEGRDEVLAGKGCDGFRVDMAGSLVKNDFEDEATAEVWRDILGAVRREYPEMAAISEWSDPEKAINKALFDMNFYLNQEGNGYHSLFRKTGGSGSRRSFFSSCGNGNIMDFLDDYLVRYNATKDHGYISF